MSENTTQIRHHSHTIHARPAAKLALDVTVARLNQRGDYDEPLAEAEIRAAQRDHDTAAAHPVAAQLLPLAIRLGNTLNPDDHFAARYEAARQLVAEQDRIDPLPAYVGHGQDDDLDTCRHGRAFSAPCADCEV